MSIGIACALQSCIEYSTGYIVLAAITRADNDVNPCSPCHDLFLPNLYRAEVQLVALHLNQIASDSCQSTLCKHAKKFQAHPLICLALEEAQSSEGLGDQMEAPFRL